MNLDFLRVRPGDPVTAELWNKFLAIEKTNQLISGRGTRVHRNSFGQTIHLEDPPSRSYPFRVTIAKLGAGRDARFVAFVAPGTVNSVEPVVGGGNIKLSELAEGSPALEIIPNNLDTRNNGFVALELVLLEDYTSIDHIIVVQCPSLTSDSSTARPMSGMWERGITGLHDDDDGKHRCRFPLARLQKRNDSMLYYQIAYWNMQHAAVPASNPADSIISTASALARHFFFPAGGMDVSAVT